MKTDIITDEQIKRMVNNIVGDILAEIGHKRDGFIIVKHMPYSSDFKWEQGSWENYWEYKKHLPFPKQSVCDCCHKKRTKLVGCHVVDVKTKQVYIYPACQSCNAKFIGKENEHPFYARKDWLVPFRVEEATCENHSKSPEELLSDALSKISSHWGQVPEP